MSATLLTAVTEFLAALLRDREVYFGSQFQREQSIQSGSGSGSFGDIRSM